MDEETRDKLEEIHTDVRFARTRVEVVDERTEQMNQRMDDQNRQIQANQGDIDSLQERTKRNTTILNGMTVGLGAAITWAFDKLRLL